MFSMLSAAQLLNSTKCQCLQVFLWVCVCVRVRKQKSSAVQRWKKNALFCFVEVMVTDLKNKNNKTGRNGKIKTFFLPHESRFIATGSFWGEGQKLALLQWLLYWVSTFWLLEVVVRGPLGITRISALITCRV